MGFDHFNDVKSTTDLPAGFSVDSSNSGLTLFDILYNMKKSFQTSAQEWIVYIIHASALEKFVIASLVMSLYLLVYIVIFVLLRNNLHSGTVAKGRWKSYFDMIEEEHERDGYSDKNEYRYGHRQFSIEELKRYNGKDGMPILVALKGTVYDVTSAFAYYGPSGSYASLAGREASRAVAKLNFDERELCNDNLDDLKARERRTLEKWVEKFRNRNYPIIGILRKNDSKKGVIPAEGNSSRAYENKDKLL